MLKQSKYVQLHFIFVGVKQVNVCPNPAINGFPHTFFLMAERLWEKLPEPT